MPKRWNQMAGAWEVDPAASSRTIPGTVVSNKSYDLETAVRIVLQTIQCNTIA